MSSCELLRSTASEASSPSPWRSRTKACLDQPVVSRINVQHCSIEHVMAAAGSLHPRFGCLLIFTRPDDLASVTISRRLILT